ncbi:hypothetical protein PRZ48_011803 [Zasmidium cellare]|uniref:Ureidoglycolate hydrolase n=1 Tax=Zasmidium cellare TaxID=395010 RepID=A0ABR0E7E3_ZASCE|nr:hypothetical protein PRZ48_011803 [Zasmidium cellare]
MSSNAAQAQSSTSSRIIRVSSSLNPIDFAPFGEVVENPETHGGRGKVQKVEANQGSATKWLDVSHLENWYTLAPSRKAAKAVMNMFVCKPRKLEVKDGREVFPVNILERHPFTPQTFIPMGVGPDDKDVRYLVIVAPTLKTTKRESNDLNKPYPAEKPKPNRKSLKEKLLGARPNPFTNDFEATTTPSMLSLGPGRRPKGPGAPDLDNIQAFIARGDQAVTYGPGTWHAPMVVLGSKPIDFVVVQYANGVGLEDCQELYIKEALNIDVDESAIKASAPGIMRAKL